MANPFNNAASQQTSSQKDLYHLWFRVADEGDSLLVEFCMRALSGYDCFFGPERSSCSCL